MKSYFIRHTKDISVRDEDLEKLWRQNKIAIHYPDLPDPVNGIGDVDNESRDPNEYPNGAKKLL